MPTVLIVDDSSTDRLRAGGLLAQQHDLNVEYAVDGGDAIVKMELHVPDMVLTDIDMPELNGLELVGVMRKAYPFVPVVLMTARGSEDIAVKALKAGAASYVPKRMLNTQLNDIVKQVFLASREGRARTRLLRRATRQSVSFTIENDQELITSLVQYLQDTAAGMGLCDDMERIRTGVALQEALTNACFHGNLEVSSSLRETDHRAYYDLAQQRMKEAPYSSRVIRVCGEFTPEVVTFTISDQGPGFDPTQLPDPRDPVNLEKPCGRGLLLMRTFMDDVSYNATGNEVMLVKRKSTAAKALRGESK